MFVIVEVYQDYDHVEDVVFVASFSTREQSSHYCDAFINNYNDMWKLRSDYIKNYVDEIEAPIIENYFQWCEFIKNFPSGRNYTPENFKKTLSDYLTIENPVWKENQDNYLPPPRPIFRNLFIIEVP